MPSVKLFTAALAALLLLSGCDRAVTRIFAPYENDSRNAKRIGTAVGSPIYRISDGDITCIAIFTPQGDSTSVSCVKDNASPVSSKSASF